MQISTKASQELLINLDILLFASLPNFKCKSIITALNIKLPWNNIPTLSCYALLLLKNISIVFVFAKKIFPLSGTLRAWQSNPMTYGPKSNLFWSKWGGKFTFWWGISHTLCNCKFLYMQVKWKFSAHHWVMFDKQDLYKQTVRLLSGKGYTDRTKMSVFRWHFPLWTLLVFCSECVISTLKSYFMAWEAAWTAEM